MHTAMHTAIGGRSGYRAVARAGLHEAKDPDRCNVFQIFRAIAGAKDPRTLALAERYRVPGESGFGYGHAKQALADLVLEHFADARARRVTLLGRPAYVTEVLRDGAQKARARAQAVVARARLAVGL